MSTMASLPEIQEDSTLLDAFRLRYYRMEAVIQEAMQIPTDTIVLQRIGDDLAEYSRMVQEVRSSSQLLLHLSLIFSIFLACHYL